MSSPGVESESLTTHLVGQRQSSVSVQAVDGKREVAKGLRLIVKVALSNSAPT